jgi:hypothetical protein
MSIDEAVVGLVVQSTVPSRNAPVPKSVGSNPVTSSEGMTHDKSIANYQACVSGIDDIVDVGRNSIALACDCATFRTRRSVHTGNGVER